MLHSSTTFLRTRFAKLALALLATLFTTASAQATNLSDPVVDKTTIFQIGPQGGAVEAEHFYKQTNTDLRAFHLTRTGSEPHVKPDGDPSHLAGASNGAYVEILPDTRRTHADKLIPGENFSNEPGKLAILHYKVNVAEPGRYYVWVRAYSTGSEDNGLHVGLDGEWPASGRRLQWCEGKNQWRWESRQRTQEQHCGVKHKIYLDIKTAGEHDIHFSMREDGFEFDKWLLTRAKREHGPKGPGRKFAVTKGPVPPTYQVVASKPKYPAHWGAPPAIQTQDIRPLPRNFGEGSSTLAAWIEQNLDDDARRASAGDRPDLAEPRDADGDGSIRVTGELKQWHKVTVELQGPFAHERDNQPNPFLDYRYQVRFRHESGSPEYLVNGYFAADGDAANSSAESGTTWRAHLSPDKPGKWTYETIFHSGKNVAISAADGESLATFNGKSGEFTVAASDKSGRDFRAVGRLAYVGNRYLKFLGSGDYFLKAGADAPETLLSYTDFDGTLARKKGVPLKTWSAHTQDWRDGDPSWQDGKGKGLIGAVNYLAGKGCNAFSFIPYNAGGDGDNVWPMVEHGDKLHYDCSKLDQWQIVFDHATTRGMFLHFKLQETENDDLRGHGNNKLKAQAALDAGDLGIERKLYCREIVARYGHELALNWNLGEENTQTKRQLLAMANYLREVDPYDHHLVVHTFPDQQDKVYKPLLGDRSPLTGASLQNSHIKDTHWQTVKWVTLSAESGKPWAIAFDESGSAAHGQAPDLGYQGFDGRDSDGKMIYTQHQVRRQTLWGTLVGGGIGVEYYFGYKFPQNDLKCEDWRSRDQSWDDCRRALEFFHDNEVPFWDMQPADELVGNPKHDNNCYCLAKPGDVYVVYHPGGELPPLDLSDTDGSFTVQWYNPRVGGQLAEGSVKLIEGGGKHQLGNPPADPDEDWAVLIKRK